MQSYLGNQKHVRRQKQVKTGFTLIEVMLVLVILVILAGFAVTTFSRTSENAKVKQVQTQIGMFKTPLDLYKMDIGRYPTSLEGLLSAPSDLANPSKWKGPYFEQQIPLDPWDNAYQFVAPGKKNTSGFDLWSSGPDGQDGTDDDIGNWQQ